MRDGDLKLNHLKVMSNILTRLEKRLYLLRVSLCGGKEMTKLKENILRICSSSSREDENEPIQPATSKEYNIALDCCDVEIAVGKVLHELTQFGTFKSLFELVQEYEAATKTFEKQKKLLLNKRDEVKEIKKSLHAVQNKTQPTFLQEQHKHEYLKQEMESSENLSYMKQLLTQKVESKKEYFGHLFQEASKKTEEFERQFRMQALADIQTFSVWLLKFQKCVDELDIELRKTFDDWEMKKREIAVLKKFRNFNLEKIERVIKQISKKQEVIEIDRKEKEIERQKAEEERRKQTAATLIQALWRGTMVRKHLGPFKIKKKKRRKGKNKN